MRVLGCVSLDLARSRTAYDTRRAIRHALDGLQPGDTVRINVGRNSVPADVADLIPDTATVQVTGPDAYTVRAWRAALGGDR
ncbi:hypothetical protein [Microbacterium sp. bgisy189]|uniref:hypothetical protein n=1 Tax=Microbacterium sp. bgisy189 TaxID=3413798 RepID=UPI003EBEB47F